MRGEKPQPPFEHPYSAQEKFLILKGIKRQYVCPYPFWVIIGHFVTSDGCLLYPSKRTLVEQGLMSALGQKQTSAHVRVMSALPPRADIGTQRGVSRGVPKAGRQGGPARGQAGTRNNGASVGPRGQ